MHAFAFSSFWMPPKIHFRTSEAQRGRGYNYLKWEYIVLIKIYGVIHDSNSIFINQHHGSGWKSAFKLPLGYLEEETFRNAISLVRKFMTSGSSRSRNWTVPSPFSLSFWPPCKQFWWSFICYHLHTFSDVPRLERQTTFFEQHFIPVLEVSLIFHKTLKKSRKESQI